MKLIFDEPAWEDYLHWRAHDPNLVLRINELIKACVRDPFAGIGKPEPLRGPLSGWWSRRITLEHRLIYRPAPEDLLIAQCRYHY